MSIEKLPPLDAGIVAAVERLACQPKVKAAFEEAQRDVDRAMAEQVELCEIEAPTLKKPAERTA